MKTNALIQKCSTGERLTEEEALFLFEEGDLVSLGEGANAQRWKLHPEPNVSYIVDRNINYTNSCITYCSFCAFYRPPGHPEEYTLTHEALGNKIRELKEGGGIQVLLQGGHHPTLKLDWYEDMLRYIKGHDVHIHGFSPSEIQHFALINKMDLPEILSRLRKAGLDSIPGGGGEILVDRVRNEISPKKLMSNGWLEVMEEAHKTGMKTTCTMMYGHVETYPERVEHLRLLREQQDRALKRNNGGGYTAFICWSLQTKNTELEHLPPTGGHDYLRTLAIARMYLDNVPNIQSSWVTQGDKIGQMALLYGANDMGSTMMEENVVRQAGAEYRMSEERIRKIITDLELTPRRRNMFYELMES